MKYISYLYRDANNYKQSGTIMLTEAPTKEQLDALRTACDEGGYFIPQQVGVIPLQGMWGKPDPEADHAWHELGDGWDIEVHDAGYLGGGPVSGPFAPEALVAKFQKAAGDGWDIFLWEGNQEGR